MVSSFDGSAWRTYKLGRSHSWKIAKGLKVKAVAEPEHRGGEH